ncbi:sensor histidine kinase [Sphingomonas sp. CARO-RG-8B-R24-01]|uniref:sensor histidine kinase n=1 Tax=Sphingomonas sp. CARO-RG-8B-R24-01 TaxID=2914831 RepID=UPI001F576943|nr:sensor histidine kinase [Sphingomonas sp. CARO-RG-8B-R24-01]
MLLPQEAIRSPIGRALLAVTLLLTGTVLDQGALALSPKQRLSQYGHRIWRVGQAGLQSPPMSIAQTADGQIWIGSSDGLYRFDGVRFSLWTPSSPKTPELKQIVHLLGSRDGSLYIGAQNGLSRVRGSAFYHYPSALTTPGPFIEDRDSKVWFGNLGQHKRSAEALCSVGAVDVRCYGQADGLTCSGDYGITATSSSVLWVGGRKGVCSWLRGRPSATYNVGQGNAYAVAMTVGPEDAIWAGVRAGGRSSGLWKHESGTWRRVAIPNVDNRTIDIWRMLSDSHGALWIGTRDNGLFRLAAGNSDRFDHRDGLGSDFVTDILQDYEGDVWVVTPAGVEQFYPLAVTRIGAREGLSADDVNSLTKGRDGAFYAFNGFAVDRITENGVAASYRKMPVKIAFGTAFGDSRGTVWAGGDGRLFLFEDRKPRELRDHSGRPPDEVAGFAEDEAGDVWVAVGDRSQGDAQGWLWRFRNGKLRQQVAIPSVSRHVSIDKISTNLAGGLWIAASDSTIYNFNRGVFKRVIGPISKVGDHVRQIVPVAPDEFWLATSNGAVWVKDGQVRALRQANGLPCADLSGLAFDARQNLWLGSGCALLKISKGDLDAWRNTPKHVVRVGKTNASLGYVPSDSASLLSGPHGQVYFASSNYVYKFDPLDVPVDRAAPSTQIEGLIADRLSLRPAASLTLPKLTRRLEIDYTGLSYRHPDNLTFKYRLFGHDEDWIDAGNRRQAFYNDLPPGRYRFAVSACNLDDVCDAEAATSLLALPPAWWQTVLFKTVCGFALMGLIWLVVRWRISAQAEALRLQFDSRLQERTRVARDLHDTLMQTVLASKLLADDGQQIETTASGQATFRSLSDWLGRAVDEGRTVVDSLRTSTEGVGDLLEAFQVVALEESAARKVKALFSREGDVRKLHPVVRDEVYRIGVEAFRNACFHARCSRIVTTIHYGQSLVVRVSDDGAGIDEAILKSGKPGHFGLIGMHERADNIGATLLFSTSTAGTDVHLRVPGRIAYARDYRALTSIWGSVLKGLGLRRTPDLTTAADG